jgi:hypothetical protein
MSHTYEDSVICEAETPRAICVRPSGKGNAFWVPKSVIHDDSEVYKDGTEGTLVVKDWYAEKEGWD